MDENAWKIIKKRLEEDSKNKKFIFTTVKVEKNMRNQQTTGSPL